MSKRASRRGKQKALRVFFSYSYSDYAIIRPVIQQAAELTAIKPIIPAELPSVGESVLGKVRRTIDLSDLVIAIFTEQNRVGVAIELEFAASQGKPLLVFAEKGTSMSSFVTARFAVTYFGDSEDLVRLLVQSIRRIQNEIRPTPADLQTQRFGDQIVQTIADTNKHSVLVLGRDSDKEGWRKIQTIKVLVSERGYYPLILRELPQLTHVSLERKMLVLGALARFVLVEDSRPSGHIDEVKICAINEFVTAVLRELGTGSTWMQAHYPLIYSFMKRFCYETTGKGRGDRLCEVAHKTIDEAVFAAIDWAEGRVADQEKAFKDLYRGF